METLHKNQTPTHRRRLSSPPESISDPMAYPSQGWEKERTSLDGFEVHHSAPNTGSSFREIREILIHNGDTFASKSAFLDSLLVFAGLFSAVLAAFLIEVHKGLQEDLLTQILQQISDKPDPSLPTNITISVGALWWTSITVALSSALFVIVAKGMGSRVIDRSEARALAEAGNVQEFNTLLARPAGQPLNLTKADLSFVRVFELLVRASTVSLALSLLLFYPGLVLLVYTANKGIGLAIASIATFTTVTAIPCLVYYSRLWAGSVIVRVAESNYDCEV
ncbi:hypothetical protein BKA70DRAFT_1562161 [Coprinopsis sp. MPI-PUGE-AT-0042]|nr:hypothetical protein BKA70DRAFT_1562161 [Coprinopsis sp. MPI-PUGE-AT-0042]